MAAYINLTKNHMKQLLYIFIILCVLSCSEDDGGGAVGGCLTSSDVSSDRLSSKSSTAVLSDELVIEYLDADGNNLIENMTYNADEISLGYKNHMITDVVDFQNEDTRYLVQIGGYSEDKNIYTVMLSAIETDTMELYATQVDFSSCTGPALAIDSVIYNGNLQKLEKVRDWLKKVSISK